MSEKHVEKALRVAARALDSAVAERDGWKLAYEKVVATLAEERRDFINILCERGAAHADTRERLVAAEAERDALRQQLATAEACRELNQEQRDEWRERAEQAITERDELKRRVNGEAETAMDAVWRALPFAEIEAAAIEIPDRHLRAASPADLCREILQIGVLLGRRQKARACLPEHEMLSLLSEKNELVRMLAEVPEEAAIDRASLTARLRVVESRIAKTATERPAAPETPGS